MINIRVFLKLQKANKRTLCRHERADFSLFFPMIFGSDFSLPNTFCRAFVHELLQKKKEKKRKSFLYRKIIINRFFSSFSPK